jgi:hypothetical protein
MAKLSKADHVRWNTSRGRTSGTVVDVRSKDCTFEDQHVTPSEDDPRYIVESDETGARERPQG